MFWQRKYVHELDAADIARGVSPLPSNVTRAEEMRAAELKYLRRKYEQGRQMSTYWKRSKVFNNSVSL
jgi:hypothetical protein